MAKKWEKNLNKQINSLTLMGVKKQGKKYPGIYRCVCGNISYVEMYAVNKGVVKSCGCKRDYYTSKAKTIHGHTDSKGFMSSEYNSWRAMKERCLNENNASYRHYGGRGIRIAKRWAGKNGFINFIADMGLKPTPEHTLERKNYNWGYVPTNCVWATPLEQGHNKRYRNNPSGYRGVYKRSETKYLASVTLNYKRKHLGTFKTAEEASLVYEAAKNSIIDSIKPS